MRESEGKSESESRETKQPLKPAPLKRAPSTPGVDRRIERRSMRGGEPVSRGERRGRDMEGVE